MSGNGFARTRRPSRHTAGSCNCSVLITRLSITCFVFLSVVFLLQLYEHRKSEYQFHKRSIRKYLHALVRLNTSTLIVFKGGNTTVKDLNLKGSRGTTGLKANSPANDLEKVLQQFKEPPAPPEMNETHVDGILMEPVSAGYARNIYFTVRSTHKYYTRRLFPLLLTWLQVVDRNKVSIISDRSPSAQVNVNMIRKAGFNIIETNCSPGYSHVDLCCKQGVEFGTYYDAVERHLGKEDDYQWYCHVDDDMYINVPQLSQFLQQHDPHKPYYFGRWPCIQRGGAANVKLSNETAYHMRHEANHTLKQTTFQYATGATFCISYALMMEAKNFFNGAVKFHETYSLAHLPDDITVGLTIGTLLGHNLTDVDDMKNHYDSLYSSSLKDLTKYLTISYSIVFARSLEQFGASLNAPHQQDAKWVFLLYHCLLYPTVSWCHQTTR